MNANTPDSTTTLTIRSILLRAGADIASTLKREGINTVCGNLASLQLPDEDIIEIALNAQFTSHELAQLYRALFIAKRC